VILGYLGEVGLTNWSNLPASVALVFVVIQSFVHPSDVVGNLAHQLTFSDGENSIIRVHISVFSLDGCVFEEVVPSHIPTISVGSDRRRGHLVSLDFSVSYFHKGWVLLFNP